MHRFLLALLLLGLPVTAGAQYVAEGGDPEKAIMMQFPKEAITELGEKSGGVENAPAAPQAPQSPAAAASATTPETPATPAVPKAPANPIDKLWPKDTVPIFVRACAQFHVELVPPCTCIITELMLTMPHDEFMRLSAEQKIESDSRYTSIRERCLATPRRKE
jgi:hypothetical protein